MIEVNEYVRTDKGYIFKVDEEKKNLQIANFLDVEYGKMINHSKQLIDLIEVGDYVNGREVKHIAMFEGFPDYPKLIFVDETHLIPDDTCENDEIQTILTKEIYMANCYKVGEEDE
mgnify:CR=1 FL=1|jgi:hypothetical protein